MLMSLLTLILTSEKMLPLIFLPALVAITVLMILTRIQAISTNTLPKLMMLIIRNCQQVMLGKNLMIKI